MALLINKEVELTPDIKISQIYVRFGYKMDEKGVRANIVALFYSSKNSYSIDNKNNIKVKGLPKLIQFDYNREDNVDILQYIHNEYANYISETHYDEEGEITYTEFTDIDNIEIIDLDEYDIKETEEV